MSPLAKGFAFYLVFLLLLAFAWPFLPFLPIGYVPGDVTTQMGSITLYLAFGTALVLDVVLMFTLFIFQRL